MDTYWIVGCQIGCDGNNSIDNYNNNINRWNTNGADLIEIANVQMLWIRTISSLKIFSHQKLSANVFYYLYEWRQLTALKIHKLSTSYNNIIDVIDSALNWISMRFNCTFNSPTHWWQFHSNAKNLAHFFLGVRIQISNLSKNYRCNTNYFACLQFSGAFTAKLTEKKKKNTHKNHIHNFFFFQYNFNGVHSIVIIS